MCWPERSVEAETDGSYCAVIDSEASELRVRVDWPEERSRPRVVREEGEVKDTERAGVRERA